MTDPKSEARDDPRVEPSWYDRPHRNVLPWGVAVFVVLLALIATASAAIHRL